MNQIALPLTVADIVDEYTAKIAGLDAAVASFKEAETAFKSATVVHGTYVESVYRDPHIDERAIRLNLRKSGWRAVYQRLQIGDLASATDKRLFEQTLSNPPDLTLDNAKATFGDYLVRPRFHKLRALAECFVQLDPAYKSHAKVKIGVAGLPKRIILTSMRGYSSWGFDRLRDTFNALQAVKNLPILDRDEFRPIESLCGAFANTAGAVTIRDIEVRIFGNGNAHVIFDPVNLRAINLALAEFYGEVLPDTEDDDAPRRPGTDVAKDLQFYPTPRKVIDDVLSEVGLYDRREHFRDDAPSRSVLEPSCGDGRIMDAIRDRGHRVVGVEVHADRAAAARAKSHAVMTCNFLETAAEPRFDYVVMNPPFYGRHWRKHLDHARKFLAPGATLACILPAGAEYDHGIAKETGGVWHDLPVASFSESGTNIPTGYLVLHRRA